MYPNLIIVEWEREIIKRFLYFCIYLKKLSISADLEDVRSLDGRKNGGGGQTVATSVIIASIYFYFTAQSVLSMLGLTVWLSITNVCMTPS